MPSEYSEQNCLKQPNVRMCCSSFWWMSGLSHILQFIIGLSLLLVLTTFMLAYFQVLWWKWKLKVVVIVGFWWLSRLAHVSQFIIGLAGPVVFTAGPSISALWFPPEQRTTATAIATMAGFAGSAVCFIYGQFIVLLYFHMCKAKFY